MREIDDRIKKSIIDSITEYVASNKRYYSVLELAAIKTGFMTGVWMGLISAGYKYNALFSNIMDDVWDNVN